LDYKTTVAFPEGLLQGNEEPTVNNESVDKLLTRRQVGRIFNPPLELSILAVMMAD
jgi:hypothetical protein